LRAVRFIVFDLDGTLVDSRKDIADAANTLLETCGAEPLAEERIGRMVGDGAAVLVARAFDAAGQTPPPDALQRFLAIYNRRLLDHTRTYAGVPEMLEALRARAPLAVLTNKPLASTRRILEALDLARFFSPDAVVGGDGPFPRKPDPAGLLHLAAAAGTRPDQTLLVGDSLIDWRTARRAGSAICIARYGFGSEGFHTEELQAVDLAIDTPFDLVALYTNDT
jgi:phosphoglycolate phosphatase